MASIRNITIADQGVNWRVGFEWNVDDQSGPWISFEAVFPRDFDDLGDSPEPVLFELAAAVARNQGIDV